MVLRSARTYNVQIGDGTTLQQRPGKPSEWIKRVEVRHDTSKYVRTTVHFSFFWVLCVDYSDSEDSSRKNGFDLGAGNAVNLCRKC